MSMNEDIAAFKNIQADVNQIYEYVAILLRPGKINLQFIITAHMEF